MESKQIRKNRRHQRVRAKIKGTTDRPRLCVFRANKHIYAQIIDDQRARTLAAADDSKIKIKTGGKIEKAAQLGKLIAQRAKAKKIEKVVFDRGGYKYHGRVKALAEGARAAGLKF
jgi:large subunit ribosomal protein L18